MVLSASRYASARLVRSPPESESRSRSRSVLARAEHGREGLVHAGLEIVGLDEPREPVGEEPLEAEPDPLEDLLLDLGDRGDQVGRKPALDLPEVLPPPLEAEQALALGSDGGQPFGRPRLLDLEPGPFAPGPGGPLRRLREALLECGEPLDCVREGREPSLPFVGLGPPRGEPLLDGGERGLGVGTAAARLLGGLAPGERFPVRRDHPVGLERGGRGLDLGVAVRLRGSGVPPRRRRGEPSPLILCEVAGPEPAVERGALVGDGGPLGLSLLELAPPPLQPLPAERGLRRGRGGPARRGAAALRVRRAPRRSRPGASGARFASARARPASVSASAAIAVRWSAVRVCRQVGQAAPSPIAASASASAITRSASISAASIRACAVPRYCR